MSNSTSESKREKWKILIEEQEKSGLSQDAFGKNHNLSLSSLAYYRGIFRSKQQSNKSLGTFSPVSVAKSNSLSEIHSTLPNGFQCAFSSDIESSRIKELIGILLSC